MFQNLAYRRRPAESSGDGAAADPDKAVSSCAGGGGTESSGGPLIPGSQSLESLAVARAFGPSDVQMAMEQQQQQNESVLPAAEKMPPATTAPSDFPSPSGSSWPSLSPMSSPSPPLPCVLDSHYPALTSAAPPSLTPHPMRHGKPNTSLRGHRKSRQSKFVKMDLSDLDAMSESMHDSDGAADDSLAGSLGSTQEVTENIYMDEDIAEEETDWVDEGANFSVAARARAKGTSTSSSRSGRGRRSVMYSSVRNRRGIAKSPVLGSRGSRGTARSGRNTPHRLPPDDGGSGPSSSSGVLPTHAARGTGRITRRRANATSNGSIAQYNLENARLGRAASSLLERSRKFAATGALSLATEDAFPEIRDDVSDDAPDAPDAETIDRQVIWAALARLPGFEFPPLDVFLAEHHPWAVAWPVVEVDDAADDNMDYAEARIQSINGVLPLGRRGAALDRLGLVLASRNIKQFCGRSLQRTRLPSFLKYSFDEQSRVCAAEAAAAGRQSFFKKQGSTAGSAGSSAVSTRPLDTIEDALASRFKLGYLANFVSAAIDMDIDTSTLTGAVPTHVDGRLAALVVQDMMSLLASARDAFNQKEAIDRAKGGKDRSKDKAKAKDKGKTVTPGSTTSKHQKQVLPAFNNAVQSMQTLRQLQSDMQQGASTEVDLFEKMQL